MFILEKESLTLTTFSYEDLPGLLSLFNVTWSVYFEVSNSVHIFISNALFQMRTEKEDSKTAVRFYCAVES